MITKAWKLFWEAEPFPTLKLPGLTQADFPKAIFHQVMQPSQASNWPGKGLVSPMASYNTWD